MQKFYARPVFRATSLTSINDDASIIDESMINADYLRLLRINVGKIFCYAFHKFYEEDRLPAGFLGKFLDTNRSGLV